MRFDRDIKILLAAFLLVVGALLYVVIKKESQINGLTSVINEKTAKIEYYENKLGETVASKVVAEADLQTLKESYADAMDSIKQRFNVKLRNVVAAASIKVTVRDTLVVDKTDTLMVEGQRVRQYNYSDKWVAFQLNDPLVSPPTLYFEYFEQYDIVAHRKSRGLFKRKELYVDVVTASPYASVTGIRSFKVEKDKSRWGIGFSAGYGISNSGLSPYLGIGATYTLLRF